MLQSNPSPVKALQAELDAAKQQGHNIYRPPMWAASWQDGMSYYFYVLTIDGPNGTFDVPYLRPGQRRQDREHSVIA